jgi:hypothetical protein
MSEVLAASNITAMGKTEEIKENTNRSVNHGLVGETRIYGCIYHCLATVNK